MKRKILIGLIVLLVLVVIAAAVIRPLFAGIPLIAVWIYLVWMFRKRKEKMSHERVEPEVAEKRLKRLKLILMVAGIALVLGIIGVVGHNVIYGLSEAEEPVFFSIGFIGLVVFTIATVSGLAMVLIGRLEPVPKNA